MKDIFEAITVIGAMSVLVVALSGLIMWILGRGEE
jgi:hypothetical protein